MKLGIVSTVRDSSDVLERFVRYHLGLGFEAIWLFFDEPSDPLVTRFAAFDRVHAVAHDESLRARWQATSALNLVPHAEREVMARQSLNAELALQDAKAQELDWLLHIDSDELFLPMGDLFEGFSALTRGGAEAVSFHNVEVLPHCFEVSDFFTECDLFKLGPGLQPAGHYSRDQLRALAATGTFSTQFFLSYLNGKSAARVGLGLLPNLVHEFAHPARRARWVIGPGLILHYANATFERFWRKYVTIGSFEDRWFGVTDIRAAIGDFHVTARDVVARGDRALAREFYRRRVMLEHTSDVEQLLSLGLLRSLDGLRNMLTASHS